MGEAYLVFEGLLSPRKTQARSVLNNTLKPSNDPQAPKPAELEVGEVGVESCIAHKDSVLEARFSVAVEETQQENLPEVGVQSFFREQNQSNRNFFHCRVQGVSSMPDQQDFITAECWGLAYVPYGSSGSCHSYHAWAVPQR